jgi:hypothetical protein
MCRAAKSKAASSQKMKKKLGLVQSCGIGDIIIALPIAKFYHDRGVEVYWPIDERFLPSFRDAVDYVTFIPFPFKPNADGFINTPLKLLNAVSCDRIVTLYSYIANTAINNKTFYACLKFDEYKYAIAGVPFAEKWNLAIKRNPKREQALFDAVVKNPDYVVVHKQGSNARRDVIVPARCKDHQRIEIDERTDCIFDWLMVLEKARFLLLIDSCFSNLVEQLEIKVEKQFVLRSDVHFTPVLLGDWSFYGEPMGAREMAVAV